MVVDELGLGWCQRGRKSVMAGEGCVCTDRAWCWVDRRAKGPVLAVGWTGVCVVYYRALARTTRLTPSPALTLSLPVPFPSPHPSLSPPHAPPLRHLIVPNRARTSFRAPITTPAARAHTHTPSARSRGPSVLSRSFRPAEHCSSRQHPVPDDRPRQLSARPWRPPPPTAGEPEPASPAPSSTPSHAKLVSHYSTVNHPRHPMRVPHVAHPSHPPTCHRLALPRPVLQRGTPP